MWKLSTGWSGDLRRPLRVRILGVVGAAGRLLDRAQGVEELAGEGGGIDPLEQPVRQLQGPRLSPR